MDQNKIDEIVAGLLKDLDSTKKKKLYTIIGFSIIVLIVFFVFMNLVNSIKDNFTPRAIAETAAYAARQVIKEGRPFLETTIKKEAPTFMKHLSQTLINDYIPMLRTQMEKEVRTNIKQAFDNSSVVFNTAVNEVLKNTQIKEERGQPVDPEFIASQIVSEFEIEKKKMYSDKPGEILGAQFEESKRLLISLNDKLELFVSKKPRNREEALELKFIKAWVSLLHKGEEGHDEIGATVSGHE